MADTYTTEQVMLLTGDTRREVYENARRYGWSAGIEKTSHKSKLYDRAKVDKFLQARAITAQAQIVLGYGNHGRLLWPVATCATCGKVAAYIRGLSVICIDGHYMEA